MSSVGETLCDNLPSPAPRPDAPESASAGPPLLVIERKPGWRLVDLGELWRYRELLYFLTWRDIKVRYKQTVLGAVWAVLQPVMMMVVFTIFFSRLGGLSSGDVPYPLFVFAGVLPWTFLSTAVSNAGQSVVGSQNLVTKVYFPRLIIPMGAVGVCLVDLVIAFAVLLLLMLGYGVPPSVSLLLLAPVALMLVVATVGVGTLLAALTVAYRDFRYVVPFLVQLWMFATPSIYMNTTGRFGPLWQTLLPLNPAYGLVAAFRQAVLGDPIDGYSFGVSSAVSVVLLAAGCLYFGRVERTFADII